jgi:hypothetical protein
MRFFLMMVITSEAFVCLYLPFSVAAHITVQHAGDAIAIAIRSPTKRGISSLYILTCPSGLNRVSTVCTSNAVTSLHQPLAAMFGNPAPPSTPVSLPPSTPIPFVPSQTISSSSSWGPMMTPKEVQELLATEAQTGEFYVVTKGRRPGVYLFW